MSQRHPRELHQSYPSDTVRGMKIAISVPNPLFAAGEELAAQLKLSRSELYARALQEYVSARGAAEITANLNRIYATQRSKIDPSFARAQLEGLAEDSW